MKSESKTGLFFWWQASINSYAQIFFSKDELLGIACLLITFFNPLSGLLGLLGIVFGNLLSFLFISDKQEIQNGYWGFNHLMISLFLSFPYQFNFPFVLLFLSANLLCFAMTFWIKNWATKWGMPYLSLPFIICAYIVMLAASSFPNISYSEKGIYAANELLRESVNPIVYFDEEILKFHLPNFIVEYLRTIAGVFFNSHLVAGLIISIALFIYSRISFVFSFLAFSFAWFMFQVYGLDTNLLSQHLLGANFIFYALSFATFFLIPGWLPMLWVMCFFPVLMLISIFLTKFLISFQLFSLTLPFVISVFISLSIMRFIKPIKGFKWVPFQYFSPEKNLYLNSILSPIQEQLSRIQFSLPFYGHWMVSQGHNGGITHLGPWSKALDFVLLDDEMKTYNDPGLKPEDYYCFSKPVLSPANGYVVMLTNDIEDNIIGKSNTKENWGNSMVIQHGAGLYTQLSHLKKGSAQVMIGDYVQKGHIVALCGSSGRSPEPHLHFQVQYFPKIGSQTIDYPFGIFVENTFNKKELIENGTPKEGKTISNLIIDEDLSEAFSFSPGTSLRYEDKNKIVWEWNVLTTAYNEMYLWCNKTMSAAYFVNDGNILRFTTFDGDKKSLLYYFFLAHYKILFSTESGLCVKENISPMLFNVTYFKWVIDIFAPFINVKGAEFVSENSIEEYHKEVNNKCDYYLFGIKLFSFSAKSVIKKEQITEWNYCSKKRRISGQLSS